MEVGGATGTEVVGTTGTEVGGTIGTEVVGTTGTEVGGTIGTEVVGTTGTEVEGTGTDVGGLVHHVGVEGCVWRVTGT
jgi:hypothetical protein